MKFKLNKKILLTIGLSFSLVFPIVLTSCGNSTSEPIRDYLDSSDDLGGEGVDETIKSNDTISSLYKKYGNQIYYRDNNDLLTLDLSRLKLIKGIYDFAFGDFEHEINRLILPPNLNKVGNAAFYPKTEKGYIC